MSQSAVGSLTVTELFGESPEETLRAFGDALASNLRVALPGIVQTFDATTQTCTVQPMIMERIRQPDLTRKWVQLPVLVDVPIAVPRAGGFALTLPIQKGDEVLIIFTDMCLDAAWEQGGVQNTQPDWRRHDLSDAIAIPITFSQPKVLTAYNTTAAELRSEDGTTKITMMDGSIDLTATTFTTHTAKGTNSW